MIKISYSRISSYLGCPQRHHFKYVQKLKPKKVGRPLSFGKDFHTLLEHRSLDVLKGIEETYYELPASVQQDLGENYIDELRTIYEDYSEVWKDQDLPIETEHEFLVPFAKYKGKTVACHGIIDEIYKDETIGEHKTFSYRPDMSTLAMNMQVCLYAKARELETGRLPYRVLWDYTRSTPAKYPIWLEKSGRFSDAMLGTITPMSWRRACKERGITDKAVLKRADLYEPNISSYFFRCSTEIIPEMVQVAWDSFKQVTKEIIKKGSDNQIKNISRDCSWCDYQPICYAQFTGSDVKHTLKTDYIKEE